MTFIDFCAGIGGFRLGLELAGYKCIGFCEKDKFAVRSYRAMFNTEGEWFSDDLTKLSPSEIPYADVWCFGFPCQNLSVSGGRSGIHGDRSSIYFDIINLIKGKKEKDKPGYLLIENVKNLLYINGGFDFAEVLFELDKVGYDAVWKVLNVKDFGIPQNRERMFIIASLRSRCGRKVLPVAGKNAATLKQIVAGSQGYRVYDPVGTSCTLTSKSGGVGAVTGLYLIDQSIVNPKITDTARCLAVSKKQRLIN